MGDCWALEFILSLDSCQSSGVRFSHLAVYCDESTQMGCAAMKPPQAHVLVHAHYTQPSCAPASSVVPADLWPRAAARAVETVWEVGHVFSFWLL